MVWARYQDRKIAWQNLRDKWQRMSEKLLEMEIRIQQNIILAEKGSYELKLRKQCSNEKKKDLFKKITNPKQ